MSIDFSERVTVRDGTAAVEAGRIAIAERADEYDDVRRT